jgi:hypothetical protein
MDYINSEKANENCFQIMFTKFFLGGYRVGKGLQACKAGTLPQQKLLRDKKDSMFVTLLSRAFKDKSP